MSADFAQLTRAISHALWSPADGHFLSVAASRVAELCNDFPELQKSIGLSQSELAAFPQLLLKEVETDPSATANLTVFNAPLVDFYAKAHPFYRYRCYHPGYVIVLTALPADHAMKPMCDRLIADILAVSGSQNLALSYAHYENAVALAGRAQLVGESPKDEHLQPSSYLLTQVCRALRVFVEQATSNPSTPEVPALFEKFRRQASAFIKKPTRMRGTQRRRTRSTRKLAKATHRHRDTLAVLNLPKPVQIRFLRESVTTDDEPIVVKIKISPETVKKAKALDFSPIELMEEQPIISKVIPVDHSRLTSVATGRFQAKQISNRNEYLRLSPVNLTSQQIKNCIELLTGLIQLRGELGLAASFLSLSLVTGRMPDSLIGLTVLESECADLKGLSEYQKDLDSAPLVILLPAMSCLALRVNTPPVVKVSSWKNVRPRSPYIVVPDYLQLSINFQRQLDELDLSRDDMNKLAKKIMSQAIGRVGLSLRGIQVSEKQLWQCLPRLMQSESGMNTAMSLLTDWSTPNSAVELHYHCVQANRLVSRYQAAMDALLNDEKRYAVFEKRLPNQTFFVGSPNCIKNASLKSLIINIEKKVAASQNRLQRENLLTLYTLMVVTAGFGFRHAISPSITLYPYRDKVLLSYKEKGADRQIILPKLVQQQLAAYQAMRAIPLANDEKKPIENTLDFFLVGDNWLVRDFHPGSFAKELKAFGLTVDLQLNSLRRWMFSELFNAGSRCIKIDFLGGHGVFGREPLTVFSSSTIDTLQTIADEVDAVLNNAGWKVLQ